MKIARRHVDQNAHWIGKLFWWLQWRKMVFFEKRACREFDTVIAVSKEDAVQFFIREILPEVKKEIPGIRLIVVGRNPSSALKKAVQDRPWVTLTGWVEDTRPYIADSSIFIVPIRIGGGTRMKIFEAMAMGKAVISTTIGAEGLPVTHQENIIIADDPSLFAKAIIELLHDRSRREDLGVNAREYVVNNFGWKSVADIFSDVCRDTCSGY